MSYRLTIDWPDGTQSQSRPGPEPSRHESGYTFTVKEF